MLPFKTILHPTDFSEASEHAFQMARGLAQTFSARLILMNIVEPPVYYGELGANLAPPEEYYQPAAERVKALAESLAPLRVEPIVVEGLAAAEILRVARETPADLIVIGSHGRTGLGRVLMGSVAEDVARKASCPVLIVRAPHVVVPPEAPAHEAPSTSQ